MSERTSESREPERSAEAGLSRWVKVGLLLVGLLLGGVVALAWFSAEPAELPMQYDGFD